MSFGIGNTPGAWFVEMKNQLKATLTRIVSMEKTLGGEKITGTSAPTAQTPGKVGQIYINVTTGEEWKCVAVNGSSTVWERRTGTDAAITATNIGAVPATLKINGKALSEDISLSASDVGASPTGHKHTRSDITDFPTSMPASDVSAWAKAASKPSYTAAEVGARPSNWTPTAANVGAVPTTRKVNGKSLSSDISLTASDVGALPSTWAPTPAELGATRIAVGTYTGDGSAYSRINVGFRPKAVLVWCPSYEAVSTGWADGHIRVHGGLFVEGMSSSVVNLRDNGFDACHNASYESVNVDNWFFCYIAFQ